MSSHTERDTLVDTVYGKLIGYSDLTDLLSTYGTPAKPSVFQEGAPEEKFQDDESVKFPYIVFKLFDNPAPTESHWLKRMYGLEIAVYDFKEGQTSFETAEKIARELEKLLDQQRIEDPGIQGGRVFMDSRGIVSPTDDSEKGAVHYQLNFTIHAYRLQMAEILSQ